MSKISLEPNASGAGTFSIVSPDSNTNRTLNLPDEAGKLLSTGNNDPAEIFKQSNILGTVSESGGVPTGAIVERDSNANGEFVKYADGTLICTDEFGLGNTSSVTSFGTFSFPSQFITRPSISFSVRASTSGSPKPYIYFYSIPTETSYEPRVEDSGTFTRFFMIAVGRWY